jgi:hypothetical protein
MSINVRPPKGEKHRLGYAPDSYGTRDLKQFEFMEYRTVTRSLEERQAERKKRAASFGYKGKDIMKVPLKEAVHEDWDLVKVDRPKPESVERAAQLFQDIKARVKELWKKWQKEHPQRPLNHELIHRLAGTYFTINDAARLGYQIQVERGLVPRSVSARRGKKIDPQNVPKMLEPCINMIGEWTQPRPAGIVFPEGKDHYIPKDYQLNARVKHTREELKKFRDELEQMLARLYVLQQEHKKDGSYNDPKHPCTNPAHKELHELHEKINKLWINLAEVTKMSVLKKLGFWIYWTPKYGGMLNKE